MNVVFDSMGTLFELTPLHERLGKAATEAWFERILHSAASLTIVGDFVPFADLARTTLATTVAKLSLDVDQEDVLAQLQQLPPAPDTRAALEQCDRAFVLTNGGREAGEQLLERAGLASLVERVFGVDEVRAYKPDPRPYRLVLDAAPRRHARRGARLGLRRRRAGRHARDLAEPRRARVAVPGRVTRR